MHATRNRNHRVFAKVRLIAPVIAPVIAAVLAGLAVSWLPSAWAASDEVYGYKMTPDDMENEFAGDPASIERGREVYAQRCAFCHGGGGKGGKGPALTAGKFKHGKRNMDMFNTIAAGKPGTQMGAFGRTIEGDDIWKLLAYIRAETIRRAEKGEIVLKH